MVRKTLSWSLKKGQIELSFQNNEYQISKKYLNYFIFNFINITQNLEYPRTLKGNETPFSLQSESMKHHFHEQFKEEPNGIGCKKINNSLDIALSIKYFKIFIEPIEPKIFNKKVEVLFDFFIL